MGQFVFFSRVAQYPITTIVNHSTKKWEMDFFQNYPSVFPLKVTFLAFFNSKN